MRGETWAKAENNENETRERVGYVQASLIQFSKHTANIVKGL